MFNKILGNYLFQNNILTSKQLDTVYEKVSESRAKLGLIAVNKGYLTTKQADELNRLQAIQDKRFGDLALEKGYLTKAQLEEILSLQGNSYLKFIQTITDLGYLSLEQLSQALSDLQIERDYTNEQMSRLQTGDLEEILPILLPIQNTLYKDVIYLAIRTMIRFVSPNIYVDSYRCVKELTADTLAYQSINGDLSMLLGFAGKGNSLLAVANPYAKENFSTMNDDAFDAVCELSNCINGLFARKLSDNNLTVELLPPLFSSNHTVQGDELIILPIHIDGVDVDFIVSIDNTIEL